MKVKDFLSVCDFEVNAIYDFSKNVYFLNGRAYAHYENMSIHHVSNNNGYITIYLNTYGYDGEYQPIWVENVMTGENFKRINRGTDIKTIKEKEVLQAFREHIKEKPETE